MTTVQIAYEVSDAAVAQIKSHLNAESLTNPNWNGAEFKIERDDFTCIPYDDSPAAATLLNEIHQIIDGR